MDTQYPYGWSHIRPKLNYEVLGEDDIPRGKFALILFGDRGTSTRMDTAYPYGLRFTAIKLRESVVSAKAGTTEFLSTFLNLMAVGLRFVLWESSKIEVDQIKNKALK